MLFCEDCRVKKGWLSCAIPQPGKCEVCKGSLLCHDVPAVKLIPDSEKTTEQRLVEKIVEQAYHEKADALAAIVNGRTDHRLTELLRKAFVERNGKTDWFETYNLRFRLQEEIQKSRRQHDI